MIIPRNGIAHTVTSRFSPLLGASAVDISRLPARTARYKIKKLFEIVRYPIIQKCQINQFPPQIRIYSPRRSTQPLVEGGSVVPKKGARIVWTNDGEFLVVTGFSKQSERTISVYRFLNFEQIQFLVSPRIQCKLYLQSIIHTTD